MDELSRRARLWDAVVVVVLAAVLVAGLVYYGTQLQTTGGSEQADRQPSPSDRPSTRPSTQPGRPRTEPDPSSAPGDVSRRCWDGRRTTAFRWCGLPRGELGLAWVFPSFGLDRPSCRPATTASSYVTVRAFECFAIVRRRPVTITYEQVADVRETEAWLLSTFSAEARTAVPGPRGGTLLWVGPGVRPSRVTASYPRLPYLASVFAPNRVVAAKAFRTLVRQRPPDAVRGVRVG